MQDHSRITNLSSFSPTRIQWLSLAPCSPSTCVLASVNGDSRTSSQCPLTTLFLTTVDTDRMVLSCLSSCTFANIECKNAWRMNSWAQWIAIRMVCILPPTTKMTVSDNIHADCNFSTQELKRSVIFLCAHGACAGASRCHAGICYDWWQAWVFVKFKPQSS